MNNRFSELPENMHQLDSNLGVWDWSEFSRTPPQQEWIIEGLLPARTAGDVFGPPDSCKSTLMYSMALSVALNKDEWFNHKVSGGKVVILGGESSNRDSHHRFAHRILKGESVLGETTEQMEGMLKGKMFTIPSKPIVRWSKASFDNGHTEGWCVTPEGERVFDILQSIKPKLIIVDTVLSVAVGCNLLDQAQQYSLALFFVELCRNLNAAILTISHSSQISQGVNQTLADRLHYVSRAGGNGAPGAWRWMMGVNRLRVNDIKQLHGCVNENDIHRRNLIAVGVCKGNEIKNPNWYWQHPAIIEVCDNGEISLIKDGGEIKDIYSGQNGKSDKGSDIKQNRKSSTYGNKKLRDECPF